MSRYLGIDYGTKRVGLALSDESRRFAMPYRVLEGREVVIKKEIERICKKENVTHIVVGLPAGLAGQETQMTRKAKMFAGSLKSLGLPVELENEFFSSGEAKRGPTKKQKIDAAAAALILQSYLERWKGVIK